MTVKISDLAKKMKKTSKEILAEAHKLGIEAKAANSSIGDIDAKKIESVIENGKAEEASSTKTSHIGVPRKKADQSAIRSRMGKALKKSESVAVAAAAEKSKENLKKDVKPVINQETEKEEKVAIKTEIKPEEKQETKETVKAESKETVKPVIKQETEKEEKSAKPRGVVIVKRADQVAEEEKARKEAAKKRAEERKANAGGEKSSEKRSGKKDDRHHKDGKNRSHNTHGQENKPSKDRGQKKSESGSFRKNKDIADTGAMDFAGKKSTSRNQRGKQSQDKNQHDEYRDGGKKAKKKEKRNNKNNFFDEGNAAQYGEISLEKKAKKKHQKKVQKEDVEPLIEETLEAGTVVINVPITVAGFCEQTNVSVSQVIMQLMKMGIVTNINANLDETTVTVLADEMGLKVAIGNVEKETVEEGLELFEDKEEDLHLRSPIITVMGHVDHGKTSLLDAIRATNVTAKESGGITQHIGASEVRSSGHKIVFLDTPGHEAFTAMRARGANITDIAVLVVAADDSVKPQTVESISHAKAAGVPIIVAMNKMDKPGANPDKVKQDLSEHGLIVEDWGGDIICVPVSAKTGDGIEQLLEMILLQAEVLELKANPKRNALGTVIEARLDKAKGPVATLLVTNGTMKSGMSVVAGTTSGRIRLMTDYKGDTIKKAGPATAVEILGLTEVPAAGDDFHVVKDDRVAREIAESRKQKQREEILARNASSTLEELFNQIQSGETKELNLIVKADVRGSVGAIIGSLEKLSNEEVKVKIIHSGVGTVTESDITLASTAGAIVIGFNVRPTTAISSMAERENVQIRTYRVIYDIIDDIENAMKGMLDPEFKEVILGQVEIRDTFKVPGVGTIGGAYVTEGKVARNAGVRVVRDGIVVHEGTISSLKRFKDDAKEVQQGYECGIGIEKYNDIKEGDIIECFTMEEIKRG